MFRKLSIAALLLIFSACDTPTTLSDSPIKLDLKIADQNIDRLEDLEAIFTVTNISDEKVVFDFPSSCQTSFIIKKNQKLIVDSRYIYGCLAVLTQLELESGESKEYPISLQSIDTRENLSPGKYNLFAFLREGHSSKIVHPFEIH